MSENKKLDKPSQLQFAEAITSSIPEVDKSVFAFGVAAYVASKVQRGAKRK